MTDTARTYDAIVIGSGLAGLTTAASLAAAGKSVVVLEQYTVVGGTTHVFRRKGRWEWQVGVHHLADCGFDGDTTTIFRGLGAGLEQITFRRMDDAGFERLIFPDLTFDTPNNWELFEERLCDVFPEERRKIHRWLKVVRTVGEAVDRGPSSANLGGLAKAGLGMGPYGPLAMLSVQKVFEIFGINPRMQTLMGISACGSLNAPPSRLPFAAYCTFYDLFINGGSWFPEGGGQMMPATLLQSLEHSGGEVITGESVEEILVSDGATRGVRTASGRTFTAPVVISTADLKKTYAELLPEGAVSKRARKRVAGYRMSDAFFNAFLGVDVDLTSSYPNRDHTVIPTWESLDTIMRQFEYRDRDTVDSWLERTQDSMPAYVHVANLKDPANHRYAPAGSSSVEVMLPIGCDYRLWSTQAAGEAGRDHGYATSAGYQRLKEALTETMIERAVTALPEIEGHVVHQEAATPITQERFTRSTQGASYGIEMNTRQFAVLRPGPKTSVKGLFLAGASCRPGPSTEGVLLSGMQTASAILGRDLLKDFREGRYLVPPGSLPANDVASWDPLAYSRGRAGAGAGSDD